MHTFVGFFKPIVQVMNPICNLFRYRLVDSSSGKNPSSQCGSFHLPPQLIDGGRIATISYELLIEVNEVGHEAHWQPPLANEKLIFRSWSRSWSYRRR